MRRSIVFALALGFVAVASACNVSARDADVASIIPLDLTGPRPTAQLTIGDSAPVTAIFDSGAAASVLRRTYAEQMALPNQGAAQARGSASGPSVQGFRTTIENARLGDAAFGPVLAVAFDIQLPLPGVDAIISPEVFSGRFIQFDFANGVARVLPISGANTPTSASEPYIGENAHGSIGRTPGVSVHLPNGDVVAATLDTGSRGGITLPHALAATLPLREGLTADEPVRLVGVEHVAYRARLDGVVHIGELSLTDPEVRFAVGLDRAIVGMRVLRNSVVTLDPAGHRAWVQAPAVAP
jgi:hypothetical protein